MVATKIRTKVAAGGGKPGLAVGCGLLLLVGVLPLRAAESPVSAELVLPVAATHVIGDHTPLIWRFRNRSDKPLAFMWEGCCRLNGRLTVTAEGRPIEPVPPGQALAHMFAKAERLEPGQPADFETRLSDWVRLRETGEYQLEGRYTGVLPEQTPQVPRGLDLWVEAATTPPIRVRLLSVADYLSERPARADARGLRLTLSGPSDLPPLRPSPFRLELRNTSTQDRRLVWPHDFQLWIMDAGGRRLGNVPTSVEGAYRELSLPPGAQLELSVPFDSGLIEGEPLGNYQVFVDLRAGDPGEPRVPSNPVPLRWDLRPAEVEQLLRQAASGSRVGLRNAPLKLLRVYVGEIGGALADVAPADASPAFFALRDQLRLASCLKGYAPIPGRVEVPLLVPADGRVSLVGPAAEACLTQHGGERQSNHVSRLEELLAIRRHLGWEIGLEVRPAPQTALGVVCDALQPYLNPQLDLAGPPRFLIADGTTNAPVAVTFRAAPIPAGLLVRLRRENDAIAAAAAWKTAAPPAVSPAARFTPEEVATASFQNIADWGRLDPWLDPQVQILVLADTELSWGELRDALRPIVDRRLPFDLYPIWP